MIRRGGGVCVCVIFLRSSLFPFLGSLPSSSLMLQLLFAQNFYFIEPSTWRWLLLHQISCDY